MGPLYAQAADILRSRIILGTLPPGAKLPPEMDLCKEIGVSSITIRRALAVLVEEGLVVRLQGKGTYVLPDHVISVGPPALTSLTEDMRGRGWVPTAKVLSVRTEPVGGEAGRQLSLSPDQSMIVISRLRYGDGVPIGIQGAHLSAALFPGLQEHDFGRVSLYEVLERVYAVRPMRARETYRASLVRPDEAKMLELEPGAAVLRSERLAFDDKGRPIEFTQSVLRGDRYELGFQLRAKRA